MKKILLSLSLLICTTLVSFGQDMNSSTEKRVNLITRVMASQLGLNESEYLRLKALNRERVVKSDEIAELYAHNPTLQSQKMQELEESFDKKFSAMLSPTQAAAYASYRLSPDTEIALSQPSAATKKK